MNFFDRFLMVLYTLAVMAALFVFGVAVLGWTTPLESLQIYLMQERAKIITGTVILFFLFISMKFFLRALSMEEAPEQAVVKETKMGQIRVSVRALENMVSRVAYQVKGVRDINPRVSCQPEGVKVFIKAELSPDSSVPDVTNEIQVRIKDYITENVGISVESVKILVEDISTEIKQGTTRKLN